jgi:hypothetical protein
MSKCRAIYASDLAVELSAALSDYTVKAIAANREAL